MGRSTRAKPQKVIRLSEKEIEKIKKQASKEAIEITSVLAMAVMVENHNLNEDQICEDMEDISRWAEFLGLHILQMKDVVDLIYGFKPVLPGLSGKTDKPPAMRVRVDGYTKKFPKLIE